MIIEVIKTQHKSFRGTFASCIFPNCRTGQWRYCVVSCRPRGRCKCLATTTAVMALLGAAHCNYWTVARPPPLPHCRPAPVSGVAARPAPPLSSGTGAGAGAGATSFQWDRCEDTGAVLRFWQLSAFHCFTSFIALARTSRSTPRGGESHSMCCLSKQQKCWFVPC